MFYVWAILETPGMIITRCRAVCQTLDSYLPAVGGQEQT
jgi:hypothetical protein